VRPSHVDDLGLIGVGMISKDVSNDLLDGLSRGEIFALNKSSFWREFQPKVLARHQASFEAPQEEFSELLRLVTRTAKQVSGIDGGLDVRGAPIQF